MTKRHNTEYDFGDEPRTRISNTGLAYAGVLGALVVGMTALGVLFTSNNREYSEAVNNAKSIPAMVQKGEVSRASIKLGNVAEFRSKLANDLSNPDPHGGRLYSPLNSTDLARLDGFLSGASNAVNYAEELNRKQIRDTDAFIRSNQQRSPYHIPAQKR